jgi:hypothetical protein
MLLSTTVIALFAVGFGVCALLVDPVGVLFYATYAGLGTYLVIRRPRNVIGWLLIVAGLGFGFALTRVEITASDVAAGLEPMQSATAWLIGCAWPVGLTAISALTMVFPTGRLPEGRWRRLAEIGLVVCCTVSVLIAIRPTVNVSPPGGEPIEVPNPITPWPDAALWDATPSPIGLYLVLVALLVAGVISLVVRYTGAEGLERLQYRWFLAAIVAVAIGTTVWVVLTFVFELYLAAVSAAVLYTTIPIAVSVAVLRYRLFEIDRIISRTVGWAIVSGLLVVVFIAVVVGLQTPLSGLTQGDTLAVAASTLLVFGLFQPVRRRVQRAVDRRFDRARVDAERTVEVLADRLRDDLELDTVRREVLSATETALRPTVSGMWLRRPGGQVP